MSYICMIANQNGIAASGDSRLTFEPEQLKLHLDHTQKVYSDPEQGLVWACCGLMIFAGIHYYKMASYILGQSYRSMGSRLNQIISITEKATAARHTLSGKNAVFTLLIGSVRGEKPVVQALDVVNGKATLRTLEAPVLIQSGWIPSLHQPKPPVEEFAGESLDELARRARERCLWAVRKDGRLTLRDKHHVQTVGGNVRVVSLPMKQP